MKKMNKILTLVFIFATLFANAQPPNPGGGVGGVGPGRPASPIDMYVYILAIAAILLIAFFAKKYKTQKI